MKCLVTQCVGEMEAQEPELGSWMTERRRGRGKSVREASPELAHPNKYVMMIMGI